MATNASKYYEAYVASHTDRFQKFRDEAYAELMLRYKDDIAYRKILQDREEALLRTIKDLGKAKTGDPKLDLGIIRLQLAANAQMQSGLEDGRAARLRILSEKGGLQVPKTSNDKIIELNQALATSGALTGDPATVNQIVNSGIEGITSSVAAGGRPAAATGQKAWEAITSSPAFAKLSPEQRQAAKDKIVAELGLDSINLGGASGATLLDVAQDVLVDRETDLLLQKEGKAYGYAAAKSIYDKLDAAQRAIEQGDQTAAQKAIDDALKGAVGTIQPELEKVQKELSKAPPEKFTETEVRQLARQKYAPEAAVFERKQFERDLLAGDPDKLLHYDAIQAVKEGKIKLDDKAVVAAQMFINTYVPLGTSKAQRRADAIKKALEFAGDDKNKRDQFLVAFHKIQMEGEEARTAPSEILPEPPRMTEVPDVGGGARSSRPPEARLAEAQYDMATRERMSKLMVDTINKKNKLLEIPLEAQTPADAEEIRRLGELQDAIRAEYGMPKYSPAEFRPEVEDEQARIAAMTARGELPEVSKPKVRTRIGDLPSMADLFSNELEALIPLSRQGAR